MLKMVEVRHEHAVHELRIVIKRMAMTLVKEANCKLTGRLVCFDGPTHMSQKGRLSRSRWRAQGRKLPTPSEHSRIVDALRMLANSTRDNRDNLGDTSVFKWQNGGADRFV